MAFFKKAVLVGANLHAVTAVNLSAKGDGKGKKPQPAFKKGDLVHHDSHVGLVSEVNKKKDMVTIDIDIPHQEVTNAHIGVHESEVSSYKIKVKDSVRLGLPLHRAEKNTEGKKVYEMARLQLNGRKEYVNVGLNIEGMVIAVQPDTKSYVVEIDEILRYDAVAKKCRAERVECSVKVPAKYVMKIELQEQIGRIAHPLNKQHATYKEIQRQSAEEVKNNMHNWIIGVFTIIVTAIVAFRWPTHFPWVHVVKNVYYYYHRHKYFKTKNEEWFLCEWCYFLNALITVTWVFQVARSALGYEGFTAGNHEMLFALFAFANGALAFSVIQARNAMVFHDINQMSMAYLHIGPAILLWCLRWFMLIEPSQSLDDAYPNAFDVCNGHYNEAVNATSYFWEGSACSPGTDGFLMAVYLCLAWCVGHFLVFDVFFKSCRKKYGKTHLYDDMVIDFAKIKWGCLGLTKDSRKFTLFYYFMHFAFNIAAAALSLIFWKSFAANTLWIGFLIFMLVYNVLRKLFCLLSTGASKMFNVEMPRHQLLELKKQGYEWISLASSDEHLPYFESSLMKQHPESFEEIYDGKGSFVYSSEKMHVIDHDNQDTESSGSESHYEDVDLHSQCTDPHYEDPHFEMTTTHSNPLIYPTATV